MKNYSKLNKIYYKVYTIKNQVTHSKTTTQENCPTAKHVEDTAFKPALSGSNTLVVLHSKQPDLASYNYSTMYF